MPALGDVLRRADLAVIGTQSCDDQLGGVVDGASVVCAQSEQMICSGDSGGPLVHQTVTGPELVGITSFAGEVVGKNCGDGYPGGFADAAALKSWLTQPDPVLAPVPAGGVSLSGELQVGGTMTCTPPPWAGPTPDSVDIQWYRSEVGENEFEFYLPIKGATGADFTITPDLAGRKLLCGATAKSAGGLVELLSDTSAPVQAGVK
jgi:hypothetical protein